MLSDLLWLISFRPCQDAAAGIILTCVLSMTASQSQPKGTRSVLLQILTDQTTVVHTGPALSLHCHHAPPTTVTCCCWYTTTKPPLLSLHVQHGGIEDPNVYLFRIWRPWEDPAKTIHVLTGWSFSRNELSFIVKLRFTKGDIIENLIQFEEQLWWPERIK